MEIFCTKDKSFIVKKCVSLFGIFMIFEMSKVMNGMFVSKSDVNEFVPQIFLIVQ